MTRAETAAATADGASPAPPAPPAPSARSDPPTSSPAELSDVTLLNDGGVHVISSDAGSMTDESLAVTGGTAVIIEEGGDLEAPHDTDWPAMR